MQALEVSDASQVAEVRRAAVRLAQAQDLGDEAGGRAAIVASELATNLLKHAGGGQLLLDRFDDPSGRGVECIAIDKGPGMADVALCLRDGYSTAGSAGQGLGAIQRQSHAFDIYSQPGAGTAVLTRLQVGRLPARAEPVAPWGGVSLAKQGESVCGDAWSAVRTRDADLLLVADGLGHGQLAADAANAAVVLFRKYIGLPPVELMRRLHDGLRATRGAAIAIARVDWRGRTVEFVGVGNIAGSLLGRSGIKKMVSLNGTAGHMVRKIQSFSYPMEAGEHLVMLHSDGIGTSWTLDRYPGLAKRHPALISAVLYRDFSRGRDDATFVTMAGTVT